MEMNQRSSSTWGEGLVEKIPVEVIGEILSRVGVARDVIRASLTCSKWREAYLKHLHTLSFNVDDDERVFRELPTCDLEMLISKTLFQSPGLRRLSILMDETHEFLASSVVGWLEFARRNLTELFYKVRTSHPVDVLEICGKQLQTLSLSDYKITVVESYFKRFPRLTSLSLTHVTASVDDLNRLLLGFPNLERAELSHISLEGSINEALKLDCPALKTLSLSYFRPRGFILESGSGIDYLHLRRCYVHSFKVSRSTILRHFKMSDTRIQLLEVECGDNLESLEITSSEVTESNLFSRKIHTPQLRTFRILDINEFAGGKGLAVDLERLAVGSPKLSHLTVFFKEDLKFTPTSSEKVEVLEIGWEWDYIEEFCEWTEKVLKCCPNVRKLIVQGEVLKVASILCSAKYLTDFGGYKESMFEMMRKYRHIEVQFVYTYHGK
ncbi:unnamed protein product [Cuscuta campestris]|uniref:F-box domain-containing protein n=1 Tax=Cuscuta campestris TaxID=132261 RepID=A0A484LYC9_9ASTE|nr:unnamed protein product [Cuscuta campestris]